MTIVYLNLGLQKRINKIDNNPLLKVFATHFVIDSLCCGIIMPLNESRRWTRSKKKKKSQVDNSRQGSLYDLVVQGVGTFHTK